MPLQVEKLLTCSLAVLLLAAGSARAAGTATTVHVELNEEGKQQVLKLDTPTVPAGKVTFDVSNASVMETHEMILVKTPLTPAQFPTNKDRSRVDEKKFRQAKEVSDIKAGGKGRLTAELTPGHYVLFCNIKNHFRNGMYAELTVTG